MTKDEVLAVLIRDMEKFLRAHSNLQFYALAFDCNAEYANFLVCMNTTCLLYTSQEAEETAKERWMLLLQLDTIECDDFELMFGDCGHIYFYITKEDLKARRFDNIWLILQCF